jgi:hypothetical protein
MERRKRDLGKICIKCSMSKIGTAHAQYRRENPTGLPQNVHDKNSRKRRFEQDPFQFRITRTFYACMARAKKQGVPFTISVQDLYDLFPKDNKCPILKKEFEWGTKTHKDLSPSVDRIIPSQGYCKDNIRFISYMANRIKNNATVEILENLLKYMKATNGASGHL